MSIFFTKMQSAGNDYIFIDCFYQAVGNPERLARMLSDRHTGVGSDGLILIEPSENADCRMRIFNADGSEGMMCGNGLRCAARFMAERHRLPCRAVHIETASGIRQAYVKKNGIVLVDMGVFEQLPGAASESRKAVPWVGTPVLYRGSTWFVTGISMGNPHCVLWTEDVAAAATEELPEFEAVFPEGVNIEIAQITDAQHVTARVIERGSGETMSCGSGACAIGAAAVLNGYSRYDTNIYVKMPGGELTVACLADGRVMLEGPAVYVFNGEII